MQINTGYYVTNLGGGQDVSCTLKDVPKSFGIMTSKRSCLIVYIYIEISVLQHHATAKPGLKLRKGQTNNPNPKNTTLSTILIKCGKRTRCFVTRLRR